RASRRSQRADGAAGTLRRRARHARSRRELHRRQRRRRGDRTFPPHATGATRQGSLKMDIHEYQAKEILGRFGVAIPPGGLAYSPEQAAYRARDIGGSKWIVKAQIHSGGRGKAGGVKLCTSEHQVEEAADHLFGKRLVTQQTGPAGKTVYRVYV